MDSIKKILHQYSKKALNQLYDYQANDTDIVIALAKPEVEGEYTLVLFGLSKKLGKSPDEMGEKIGNYLIENCSNYFKEFNLIKGFLNITVSNSILIENMLTHYNNVHYGKAAANNKKVMVEYSSPNTNKPLHLGHLRNIFLGWSMAEIYKANGFDVVKTCIVNDRGIHICKSMLAWQKFANGNTPQSTNMKGDHFVGDYYVKFSDALKQQVSELTNKGVEKEAAEKQAAIMLEAQQMLLDWENGKPEVVELWKKMNSWVYEGFDATYKKLEADFDKIYYESETYKQGKKAVQDGLAQGVFTQKDDNSIWIDLTNDGLDEKLVQRKDGTSVYITQDIALAQQKYDEYNIDESIYVIGDEQNYHMKVLKLICKKLGLKYADQIHHLSYGMVELTSGKMKSREGTVVDADDLIDEMLQTAKEHTEALGKTQGFTNEELEKLYYTLGLGALKFYLLRVEPKKRIVFNPQESIDFHGFTGPFIQYTHARIKSILRKEQPDTSKPINKNLSLLEKNILLLIERYSGILEQACQEQNPSVIANYCFELAKTYNSFYAEHSVLNADTAEQKNTRLFIAAFTANILKSAMQILGIHLPEQM